MGARSVRRWFSLGLLGGAIGLAGGVAACGSSGNDAGGNGGEDASGGSDATRTDGALGSSDDGSSTDSTVGADAAGNGDGSGSDDASVDASGSGTDDGGPSDAAPDVWDGGPTLVDVVVSGGDAGIPGNVSSIFDPGTHTVVTNDPTNNPTLVYPVNDTMFPQNLYRVLFQWNPRSLKLFKISFTSPRLTLSVYTDGVHATCTQAGTGGACWESTEGTWEKLAGLNAGQDVTVKVQGVTDPSASTIYESPAYTFHFSKEPVPGALYYWSTTVAGVRRGLLGDPGPTNFMTPAQADNKCVACHTLSRNGQRMAADVGGENLTVVTVSATIPPPVVFGAIGTPVANYASSWATFNPSTTRVIGAKGGVMTLRNDTTGAGVSVVQPGGATNASGVILQAGQTGVQPDWAPDGNHVVFTRGSTKDRGGGTSIAWMSANGDQFGAIQDVFARASTAELLGYPMFSPTSDYVAFVRGKAIESDLQDQIWLVPAQAAGTPQLLVRANTLVNDYPAPSPSSSTACSTSDLTRCIENNMPTWAPSGEPGLQWVAFASQRDYGFVLRSGSTYKSRLKQLWIAAIDTSKLGTGDPSYPAFRVPFMELTENAHRPFWAEDAFSNPDGGAPDGGAVASDAGPPDAGSSDAGDAAVACLPFGGDCSSGQACCSPNFCQPDVNDNFLCLSP